MVGVDRPMKAPSMHIQKPYSGKYQIAPSKAVVEVDRPMKAPSMHIQKPYSGKIV